MEYLPILLIFTLFLIIGIIMVYFQTYGIQKSVDQDIQLLNRALESKEHFILRNISIYNSNVRKMGEVKISFYVIHAAIERRNKIISYEFKTADFIFTPYSLIILPKSKRRNPFFNMLKDYPPFEIGREKFSQLVTNKAQLLNILEENNRVIFEVKDIFHEKSVKIQCKSQQEEIKAYIKEKWENI